eukprot:1586035-Rhodomonas_salina.1
MAVQYRSTDMRYAGTVWPVSRGSLASPSCVFVRSVLTCGMPVPMMCGTDVQCPVLTCGMA